MSDESSSGLKEVRTIEGIVSTFPYQLKVSNGSLIDNGDGTSTLTVIVSSVLDSTYLRLDTTNDPLTGDLTLPTLYATDTGYSEFNGGIITTNLEATDPGYSVFNGGIIIKSGQKLIFDGAG